MNGLMGGLC